MSVQRFLGAAFATVHGPNEPRRLLVWSLEAKFRGMLAAPGPRATDWRALQRAARDLPVRFAGVRAGSVFATRSATAGLAAASDAEQRQALVAIADAVGTARILGVPTVILEPGLVNVLGEVEADDLGDPHAGWTLGKAQALVARRKAVVNGALDRVCRALFDLVRAHPEICFALTAGRSLLSVADRAGLLAIFEDLHQLRLGYWHDAAAVARREQVLAEAAGDWLEDFGNRCVGFTLSDAVPDGMYLPPGAGGVDYGLLATYVLRSGRPVPGVLELDPAVDPGELPGAHACLDKYGL